VEGVGLEDATCTLSLTSDNSTHLLLEKAEREG
jgi:hypothetical protein